MAASETRIKTNDKYSLKGNIKCKSQMLVFSLCVSLYF